MTTRKHEYLCSLHLIQSTRALILYVYACFTFFHSNFSAQSIATFNFPANWWHISENTCFIHILLLLPNQIPGRHHWFSHCHVPYIFFFFIFRLMQESHLNTHWLCCKITKWSEWRIDTYIYSVIAKKNRKQHNNKTDRRFPLCCIKVNELNKKRKKKKNIKKSLHVNTQYTHKHKNYVSLK